MKNKIILLLIAAMLIANAPAVAANSAPVTPLVPVGVSTGLPGTSYSYTTKSVDVDGNQIRYIFDWGDGTKSTTCLVNQGTQIRLLHKWAAAGTYQIKVQAKDSLGAASAWSAPLTVVIGGTTPPPVVNRAPVAPSTPSGPTSGSSGTAYSYSTVATDPDGNKVKYTFNWGDGTSTTTGLVSSGSTASASHTWTVVAGTTKTFQVTAKATDEAGLTSPISGARSVTISSPAQANDPPTTPSIPSGELTGKSGVTYTYFTKATDPDGNRVKYTFDWGDGTESTTSLVSSGATAGASHFWILSPGSSKTFSVRAKATDEHGSVSSWSSPRSVIILAAREYNPPTIPSKPSGPTSGISGDYYTYSTSSTDPDGDTIKYIFDWGDGSTETGYFPSGQVVTATHSWDNVPAGKTWSYKVRAFCADSKNKICPYPYWSDELIVTMTGPAMAMAMELEEEILQEEPIVEDLPVNDSENTTEEMI